jgi:hypothetical protein
LSTIITPVLKSYAKKTITMITFVSSEIEWDLWALTVLITVFLIIAFRRLITNPASLPAPNRLYESTSHSLQVAVSLP